VVRVEEELRAASQKFACEIEQNYQLTIEAAEGILIEVEPTVIKWLMKLSENDRLAALQVGDFGATQTQSKQTREILPPPSG
jgi:hypothetical protein